MKNDVRKLAFVFAAAALLAGGAVAHVSSAEVLEVGAAKGDKITTIGDIVSGKKYVIGASTEKYFKAPSDNCGTTSTRGQVVSSLNEATVFTLSGSGSSWSFQFANGNYLSLNSTKDNGTYRTSESEVIFTASDQKSLIQFVIGDFAFKFNSDRFGSYAKTNTSQPDVWLAEAEDEIATSSPLSSIEIGGNATKKTYFVGDVFDPSGLTVTGYFEDGTNQDLTSAAEWSYDPATLSLGNTTLTATASVTVGEVTKTASELIEGLTVEESKAITYSKLTNVADLKAGSQVVFANSDGSKLMGFHKGKNNIEAVDCGTRLKDSNVVVEPTVDTDVGVYIAEKGSVDGTFAFKDSKAKQYLYAAGGSKNNYLKLQENIDGNASFEVTLTGANPEVVAKGSATKNNLKYNSTSNLFACYESGQQAISMYVYNPAFSENGGVIVDMLLNELACDNGVTAPDLETWNTIAEFYAELVDTDKAIMKSAKADVAGSDLEKAMAKYEYIVGKYTTYADFIGRGRDSAQANNVLPMMSSNDKTTILLSVMGVAGVALAGAFFLSRKRKMAR